MKKTWFIIGYEAGFSGQEKRSPENYHARMEYQRGWDQGDTDRICAAAGYKVIGPNDPFSART